MRKTRLREKECYAVEDSYNGISAACSAGIHHGTGPAASDGGNAGKKHSGLMRL